MIKGESVAAMGGFTGRETVLTSSYLAPLVRSGEARYFLLGGPARRSRRPGRREQRRGVHDQVRLHQGLVVRLGRQRTASSSTLYDCAGKAAAIAAAA